MDPRKRVFDCVCASALAFLISPILIYLAWRVWREKDGPIFHVSERMRSPTQSFRLLKFRTMTVVDGAAEHITGGDKAARITELGARFRAKRLDELPQLWNVIKGDISFVGPRPPLRRYVEAYPELYTEVLKTVPGVTGLASLTFAETETRLLSKCQTEEETENTYCQRCIPRKARLDEIYRRNYSPCLDYWIIYETLRRTYAAKKIGKSPVEGGQRL